MHGTTTAIIEIGWNRTRALYATEFHPKFCKDVCLQTSQDYFSYFNEIKEIMKVDSILIIEREDFCLKEKKLIAEVILENKIFQSFLFIKNIVCDAFGHGKTTCMVIRGSEKYMSTSVIQGGIIQESCRIENGMWFLESKIHEIIKSIGYHNDKNRLYDSRCILEDQEEIAAFESISKIKISQAIEDACNQIIQKTVEMRSKYRINKKNTSNGCIILSGPMFEYKPFYNYMIQKLNEAIPKDFTDFFLRDHNLDCTILGASIFAANDKSKMLYITKAAYDNIGETLLSSELF